MQPQRIEIIGTVTKIHRVVDTGKGEVLNFEVEVAQKKDNLVYQVALWNEQIEHYQRFAKKGLVLKIEGSFSIENYTTAANVQRQALQISNPIILPVLHESAALQDNQPLEVPGDELGEPSTVEAVLYV